ncbi:GMC family oxidoreductase [Sinorhizobium meliloti]|uniref:GMC family oxidoreductase n=1 Tax=Rhizobium meliloti TaxID=382 RepID=UPI000373DBA0|nr:GMC family oxidoreductase [Sinorhizobium meliloti]
MTGYSHDVAIIGSGFAGSLIASALAERGVKVVIIEAGKAFEDNRGIREELRQAFANSNEDEVFAPYMAQLAAEKGAWKTRPYKDIEDPIPSQFSGDYLRMVGGTGLAWLGTALRMCPNDFRMKTVFNKGRDWPISYADLESWYSLAEEALGIAGDPEVDTGAGAFRTRPFPMPPIPLSYSDKYIAARIASLTFADQRIKVVSTPQARNSVEGYNGRPQCEGYASCVPLCPTGAKYDPLVHLRRALLSGADLLEQSVVTGLQTAADGSITAANLKRPDGSIDTIGARTFVLAANGIETPKLLLQSNQSHDAGLANESGLVGRNLMDHPQKYSCAFLPDPIFPFRGPQSTAGIEALRDGSFRRHRAAFRTALRNDGWRIANGAPFGSPEAFLNGTLLDLVERQHVFGSALRSAIQRMSSRQFALQSVVEALPCKENRISLSQTSRDAMGLPRAEVYFRIGRYEREGITAAAELHRAVFAAIGCRDEDVFIHLKDDPSGPDAAGSHIMGTTVMGSDPKVSVVDPNCRAFGHQNLFIVGSSVFPTGSASNPTLTICALALRAAEFIGSAM